MPVIKLLKNTADQDIFVWSYEVHLLCSNGSSCSQLKTQLTKHTHLLVSIRSKSKNQLLVDMQLLMVYCSTLAASTHVYHLIKAFRLIHENSIVAFFSPLFSLFLGPNYWHLVTRKNHMQLIQMNFVKKMHQSSWIARDFCFLKSPQLDSKFEQVMKI